MIGPMPRRRALSRLAALGVAGPRRLDYAQHPGGFGELTMPAGEVRGVVVVVHGGFWRQAYGLELGRPLAVDLANAGLAAWNIEYRRVGTGGAAGDGGWPTTFLDVAVAVDLLAGPVQEAAGGRLPLDRVIAAGHSAGGHLAGWLAARPGLPPGAPGAAPAVLLRGAVSQAGVLDLVDAAEQRLGAGAVRTCSAAPPPPSRTGTRSSHRPRACRWGCPSCASTAPRTPTCRSVRASASSRSRAARPSS